MLVITAGEPEAFVKRRERLFTSRFQVAAARCPYSRLSILAILSPVMSANGQSALSHGEQPAEYAGAGVAVVRVGRPGGGPLLVLARGLLMALTHGGFLSSGCSWSFTRGLRLGRLQLRDRHSQFLTTAGTTSAIRDA